jgi:hypothetical protein
MTVKALVVPAASGDVYGTLEANYGAVGESPTLNTDTDGPSAEAATISVWNEINSLSLATAAIGDHVEMMFSRNAAHASDTVNDWVSIMGFVVTYTADS